MAANDSVKWNGQSSTQPQAGFVDGYDVKTTSAQASDRGASAYLIDQGDNTHILLHIVAVGVGLQLVGTTAQGQMTRDFYAKSFQQPVWSIEAQAPSQEHAGRISEFVHKAQRNAVSKGSVMQL